MKMENDKYDKVLNLLQKSTPLLNSTGEIENEVIRRVKKLNQSGVNLSEVIDFLFGWVYIGWVRRSLITASMVLILIFVYQQGVILKRIEVLSRQTVIVDKEKASSSSDEIDKLLTLFRNSGHRFPTKNITFSESQMKELQESLKEMQIKYKDLENLIESDPELKSLIEKKLIENNRTKINL
jgi:hypothetical protein